MTWVSIIRGILGMNMFEIYFFSKLWKEILRDDYCCCFYLSIKSIITWSLTSFLLILEIFEYIYNFSLSWFSSISTLPLDCYHFSLFSSFFMIYFIYHFYYGFSWFWTCDHVARSHKITPVSWLVSWLGGDFSRKPLQEFSWFSAWKFWPIISQNVLSHFSGGNLVH